MWFNKRQETSVKSPQGTQNSLFNYTWYKMVEWRFEIEGTNSTSLRLSKLATSRTVGNTCDASKATAHTCMLRNNG